MHRSLATEGPTACAGTAGSYWRNLAPPWTRRHHSRADRRKDRKVTTGPDRESPPQSFSERSLCVRDLGDLLSGGTGSTGDVAEDGLGEATVDADVLSGDVARQRADEELNHVRDVCGVADPGQRDDVLPPLLYRWIGVHLLGHRRVSHPRRHHVHTDSVGSPFQGERLG